MEPSPDLLMMCLMAFASVFGLLSVLAVLMRIITGVFPHRPPAPRGGNDPAIAEAIKQAVAAAYPNMTVAKIEEEK